MNKLARVGWETDGSQIGWVTVEIYEQPTVHRVHVGNMLGWIKSRGRTPRDETPKSKPENAVGKKIASRRATVLHGAVYA